jgi:hypothetical protein
MYVVTGEKTYLLTDYCPRRKYILAKFTDGNGNEWWQLAYMWGYWTYYLNRLGYSESGWPQIRGPMLFDNADAAMQHLERERDWRDQEKRSREISVEFINKTGAS